MTKLDRDTRELVNNMIRYQPCDRKISAWAGCTVDQVANVRRIWMRDHSGRMEYTSRSYQPTSRESTRCEAPGADKFTRGAIKGSAKLLKALQKVAAA